MDSRKHLQKALQVILLDENYCLMMTEKKIGVELCDFFLKKVSDFFSMGLDENLHKSYFQKSLEEGEVDKISLFEDRILLLHRI